METFSKAVNEIRRSIDEKARLFIGEMTGIVNAGGLGVRLRPYTLEQPKPLIKVGVEQRPLMYWAMLPLLLGGVSKFVVTLRYGREAIKAEFGSGEELSKEFGREIEISYVEEPEPLGRAGCIKLGLKEGKIKASKPALIINASDILSLNLLDLVRHHLWQRAIYGFEVTQVYASGYRVQYGVGRLHPTTGQVLDFVEKPKRSEPINAACYCLQERLRDFERLERFPSNPEDELVHKWIKEGVLGSYVIPQERIISIKFEKDLEKANQIELEKFVKSAYEGERA